MILLLGIYLKELKTVKHLYTNVIAALFTISKGGRNPDVLKLERGGGGATL